MFVVFVKPVTVQFCTHKTMNQHQIHAIRYCTYIYIHTICIVTVVALTWHRRVRGTRAWHAHVAPKYIPTATYRRIYAPKSMPRNMLRPGIIRSEYLRRKYPGSYAPELPRKFRYIHTGIRVNSGSVYIQTCISTPESGSIKLDIPAHIYRNVPAQLPRNYTGIWP